MAGTLHRSIPNRPGRRRNNAANRPQPTVGIGIASVTTGGVGSPVLAIQFDQPVSLKGVPQYTTDVAGVAPLSAQMTDAATLELTFDADVSAATTVNIPYESPAVRNASGGFVTPSSVSV